MTHVGQCPHCRAVNSYEVAQCLDCHQPLPWAGTVQKYLSQMEKARTAVQQLQAQVQQLQQAPPAPRPPLASSQVVPGATGMPPVLEDTDWTSGNRFREYTAAMLGERVATVFDEMGEDRARIAAFLLAGFWNLCVLLGTWLILRNLAALMGSFLSAFLPSMGGAGGLAPSGGFPGLTPPTPTAPELSLTAIIKILAVATFAWGVLVGLCAAVRAIGRGEGSFAGDLFIAGVALLPAGLFWVLTGVVGLGNYSFVGALWIVSSCYVVVAAYRGLVTISRVPPAVAALCVPLMFLLDGALFKVVVTRLLSP